MLFWALINKKGDVGMKKFALALLLVAVVIIASGCVGSGGSSSGTPETGSQSTGWESSTSKSTSSVETTKTTSETHSTSSTPSQSETGTQTSTSIPQGELYWKNPWEYSPIVVDGERYFVTHYVVLYRVRPNETSPLYEYRIEKTERKTNVTVYGLDFSGSKTEVGSFEVYEYETVITPVKAVEMDKPVTIRVWYTTRTSEAFIYPWDMGWASSTYGDNDFVGFKIEYDGRELLYTNPPAVGKSVIPYIGGDQDIMSDLNPDLMNLYTGWFAVLHVGLWGDWSARNLLEPQKGAWSDYLGHAWEWETRPDGTVEFSGIEFRVVEGTWSYSGPEGVSMSGRAKIAPKIFIPLEVDGNFTSLDESGNPITIYGYFKVERLDLVRAP